MMVTEREVHYHIISIIFPTRFFGLIVLYLFFKGRFKRRR